MSQRSHIGDFVRLSSADAETVAVAVRFADEHVRPRAASWHRLQQPGLPADVVAAWQRAGLLAAQLPTEQGGLGMSFLGKIGVVEVLARQCLPSSFALCNVQNGPGRLLRDGSPDQIRRYVPKIAAGELIICPCLTEPQSGSDFAAMRTTARRVEGGWRLDGEKAWITNAVIAHLGVVYAQTDAALRGRGIAAFLVNLSGDGVEVTEPYDLAVGSVIGVAGLRFKDAFVPDADVLQAPGQAFLKALTSINSARTYVAAMCCGMVDEALHLAIEYGRGRRTFGQPLVAHQGVRWSIADIATDLEAARLLTYRAAQLIAEGQNDAAIGAAAMAKKHAVEMAERCLPACLQLMGARGLRSDLPLARHILSAKIASFVDGSTEIQNERIGQLATAHEG
jgi:alkylation response protein AidB-like acyl-CoA dehydrogenase